MARRFWFRLLAVCCAPAAMAQQAATPGWGLEQLAAGFAQVKSASARFTERQTMALLSAPLVTSGTLDYRAPDWMRKQTVAPVAERFVLDGGRVTISGGGHEQVFSVADDPSIGGLTLGILATLAGNLTLLEQAYLPQLSGGPADWRLLLRPRDANAARLIDWIVIRGDGNRIEAIDTRSGNGDHTEMSVEETIGREG